jgi:glycosyltransferase involved in cell wall biosynthesis
MAHILLVADLFLRRERTGIDKYYDQLVYWLPRLAPQHDFTLVSFGEPDQNASLFSPNMVHKGLPISRRRLAMALIMGMPKNLSALVETFDLVHLMIPFPITAEKPMLITTHDLTPVLIPNAYSWYHTHVTRETFRRLGVRDNHFCVISYQTGTDLHNLFRVPRNRIHCVYQGVGEEFRAESDVQRVQQVRAKYHLPRHYFLYIGSMHRRKNLSTLLKAYQRFILRGTINIKLAIAGRMSLGGDQLRRHIREQKLENEVVLPGYIDSADLSVVIGEAVALLYPSLYEGFGLPVLEAMACGTPVIASRAGSIPEVAGGHALLCDPLEVECFSDAMFQIAVDAKLRAELIEGGLNWATQFSWQATALATLQLYEKILGDAHI